MVYAPKTGIKLPGTSGNYISTPDTAALDITGDICIIVDVELANWSVGGAQTFVAKWAATTSFIFYITTLQRPGFTINNGGTNSGVFSNISMTHSANTRTKVAVTLDADNGSSQYTRSFWTLDSNNWVLLDTIATAGTAAINNSSVPVELGSRTAGTLDLFAGNVYSAQVYDGIGDNSQPGLGTLVAEFDAAKCKPRYRDSTGKIWTLNGSDSTMEKV